MRIRGIPAARPPQKPPIPGIFYLSYLSSR